ncbi:unnamed protein product [Amoebophrya sp. A120]|nr:unnamed protein product [Amoebophrya sp. A120]|eukprot:GSA120T00019023001.1
MPAVVSSSTGDVASSAVISNAATAAVASGDAKISSTASSSESGQVTVMPLVMPMPTAQAKDHPAENQEAKRDMFAFDQDEEGGAEKEEARLARWKKEDPIALQDAFMTSNAFLKACKDDNLPEALEILQNSVKTDFLQYHVIQGYYACIQNLNFELFHQVFQAQGFPVGLFPEIPHAIAELCTKETFPVCRKFFQPLFRAHQVLSPQETERTLAVLIPCAESLYSVTIGISIMLATELAAFSMIIVMNLNVSDPGRPPTTPRRNDAVVHCLFARLLAALHHPPRGLSRKLQRDHQAQSGPLPAKPAAAAVRRRTSDGRPPAAEKPL